jgi:hypothetical protein
MAKTKAAKSKGDFRIADVDDGSFISIEQYPTEAAARGAFEADVDDVYDGDLEQYAIVKVVKRAKRAKVEWK